MGSRLKLAPADLDRAVQLRASGASWKAIGSQLGCHHNSARDAVIAVRPALLDSARPHARHVARSGRSARRGTSYRLETPGWPAGRVSISPLPAGDPITWGAIWLPVQELS